MKCWALIQSAVERHGACALVSVLSTEGSAPRDAGARIVVTPEGYHGSIGGGTLEWHAIATAQAMLSKGASTRVTSHSLGPDLGQCCGGRVKLATEVFDRSLLPDIFSLAAREAQGPFTIMGRIAGEMTAEQFGEQRRALYLFGAGHVGRAMVLALAPLSFDVQWVDARPGAFPLAVPQNVTLHADNSPSELLLQAKPGSMALVMTHSHGLDLEVTDAALRNASIAYVGLIGSATKRTRFEKRLREAGVVEERVAGLICPIGIDGIHSKEPAMIAASAVAQLIALHERLAAAEAVSAPAVAKRSHA